MKFLISFCIFIFSCDVFSDNFKLKIDHHGNIINPVGIDKNTNFRPDNFDDDLKFESDILKLHLKHISKIKISKSFLNDIHKGTSILNNNSKFDIGQSILIQEGNVIGIEAAQGTDNLIKQSLPYMQKVKKGVLIKLTKVKQDLRADLPTIGLKTLKNCLKSGVVGIAYSANKTIFLDKDKILNFCRNNRFFLYGL